VTHEHIRFDSAWSVHTLDQAIATRREDVKRLYDKYAAYKSECDDANCALARLAVAILESQPNPLGMGIHGYMHSMRRYIMVLEENLAMAVRMLHEERHHIADAE
jgi:hypothetical protein